MRYENDRPIYLQVIEDISRRLVQGELTPGREASVGQGDWLCSIRSIRIQPAEFIRKWRVEGFVIQSGGWVHLLRRIQE